MNNPAVFQIEDKFLEFNRLMGRLLGEESNKDRVSLSMLNILWFLWEDLVSISNSLSGIFKKLPCSSGNPSQRSVHWGVAFMLIVNKDCFGRLEKVCVLLDIS